MYYLNSRYYDPEAGRFINADGYVSTGQGLLGCNMYVYCNNNPVTYADPSGKSPIAASLLLDALKNFVEAVFMALGVGVAAGVGVAIGKEMGGSKANSTTATRELSYPMPAPAPDVLCPRATPSAKEVEAEAVLTRPLQNKAYNYWEASLEGKFIIPGEPLTYSMARMQVDAGNSLLCRDHASAIAIVKFYPSARWEPAHNKEKGYLNHYHLSSAHDNHIWYFGE